MPTIMPYSDHLLLLAAAVVPSGAQFGFGFRFAFGRGFGSGVRASVRTERRTGVRTEAAPSASLVLVSALAGLLRVRMKGWG